jgi:hypothetical protein
LRSEVADKGSAMLDPYKIHRSCGEEKAQDVVVSWGVMRNMQSFACGLVLADRRKHGVNTGDFGCSK